MSLLTIVQNVADEVGIPQPTTVINNNDQSTAQILRMVNRQGQRLLDRYDWEGLTAEATHTTLAAASQGAITTIASNFHHIINDSMFNRTQNERIHGPMSPLQWQRQQANNVTLLDEWWRLRGGLLLVFPTMTAGETLAFEYQTTLFAESSGGTGQTAFTADADVGVLPEALFELGVIWRFLKAKGLDYSEPFRDYELALAIALERDGGAPRVNMGYTEDYDPRDVNFPDGSWSGLS